MTNPHTASENALSVPPPQRDSAMKPNEATTVDTAALRALHAAATPAPWSTSREDIDSYTASESLALDTVAYVYRKPEDRIPVFGKAFRHDARLIAAMRNALPALLDRLDAAAQPAPGRIDAATERVFVAVEQWAAACRLPLNEYEAGKLAEVIQAAIVPPAPSAPTPEIQP